MLVSASRNSVTARIISCESGAACCARRRAPEALSIAVSAFLSMRFGSVTEVSFNRWPSDFEMSLSQQQIEQPESGLPVLRLGIFEMRIDDFEAPRERDARSTMHRREPQTGLFSVLEIERRQLRAAFQYRVKLDLLGGF